MPKDSDTAKKTQTSPKPQDNTPGASPVSKLKKVSTKTRGKGKSTQSPKSSKNKGSGRTKKPSLSKRQLNAKKRLLALIEGGATLPTAIAIVCLEYKYKCRDTVYKWYARSPGFAEEVLIAELSVAGKLEQAEMLSAEGNQLVEESKSEESYPDGAVKKVSSTKRFAPANPHAIKSALIRRTARLRKVTKSANKGDALNEVSPAVPMVEDEDGNVIMPFETLCVTFASLMSKVSSEPEGKQ